jgi:hypothetical protein
MEDFMPEQTLEAEALLKAIDSLASVRYKHDLGTPISLTTNLMHGQGGIFGFPGIDRDVFATRVKPRGLMQILPASGSIYTQPLVAYLTGFTDDQAGSEKNNVCDVPLAAGQMKSCLQGALFGRYERKTEQFEINQALNLMNRGEMIDLRLVNDPLLENGLSVPSGIPKDAAAALNRQVLALWMNLGIALERLLGPQVYTGTPANNTVNGGYQEFHGLETLVGTGKIDVITSTACKALDSDLRNFGYKRIDSNASALFAVLTSMVRNINDIASRTGLDPVTHAFTMRRNLFDDLADVWPCAYATYRCAAGGVTDATITQLVVDSGAQRQMAEDMRNGKYLIIDGVKIPVIIDDFIPEDSQTNNANLQSGCFASDIYYLPLTVRGGIVSLFFEYYNFAQTNGVMQAIADGHLTDDYWTDGGRYLWTKQRTGWCVEWWAMIKPRLRLLTPHLAGRVQNVAYCPSLHFREDVPSSPYFFDGGVTSRTNTQYDSTDFPSAQT